VYQFTQDWAPHHASRPTPHPRPSAARHTQLMVPGKSLMATPFLPPHLFPRKYHHFTSMGQRETVAMRWMRGMPHLLFSLSRHNPSQFPAPCQSRRKLLARLFHLGWRMGHTCPRWSGGWSGLRMGLPPGCSQGLRLQSPPRQLLTFIQPATSHRCPALQLVFRG
jgi:hypothetical protein